MRLPRGWDQVHALLPATYECPYIQEGHILYQGLPDLISYSIKKEIYWKYM